jgi:hypothetical protein
MNEIQGLTSGEQVEAASCHSSSFQPGDPRPFGPLRPSLFTRLRCPGGDLHQPSESRRNGSCTDYRTGNHQPFPASIHLQIQTFQSAGTEEL